MQLSLAQFGLGAIGGPAALERLGEGTYSPEEPPAPIELDLSEAAELGEAGSILYNAAELLIISISGCSPKRR